MPREISKGRKPERKRSSPFSRKTLALARNVRLLIVDVDGVLTDGGIVLDEKGNEIKKFHVRDGHGIKLLQRNGVEVAIITGRTSGVVSRRAQELGIGHVYQKSLNKIEAYEKLKKKLSVSDLEVGYVGDDVVDIPVMKRVGLSVAVADAHEDVISFAHHITEGGGGQCAVREVCEMILKAKGLWKGIIDGYTKA